MSRTHPSCRRSSVAVMTRSSGSGVGRRTWPVSWGSGKRASFPAHSLPRTELRSPSLLAPGKTINLRLDGVDNESLILMLDNMDICVSAGSACQSHESKPSHVLTAMGLTTEEARSSIRVSFSRMNTVDEVMDAARIMASFIDVLHSHRTEE